MQTLDAHTVDKGELDVLRATVSGMPEDSVLRGAIAKIAAAVDSGQMAIVVAAGEHLTPSLAAKMLGVSRAHLYKLLDAGAIPFVRVGRDRRIEFTNLFTYMVESERHASDFAKRMSRAESAEAAAVRRLANVSEEDAQRLGF